MKIYPETEEHYYGLINLLAEKAWNDNGFTIRSSTRIYGCDVIIGSICITFYDQFTPF